jgi:Zn-dependent protease/predicted transcriptional regulator
MRWSLPLGRVFGIALRLHITFLLLLGWVGYEAFVAGGPSAAKWELLRVCLIFLCIILHELGHSVVAQRLGVEVKSITLLPIGGVAALRNIPENPWHEIAITLAGPMVNAVIALVLFPFVGIQSLTSLAMEMTHIPHDLGSLTRALVGTNILLFAFNFIPAFPMDGGRLLRASLALFISYRRATTIATFVGQGMSILFVLFGLRNPGMGLMVVIGIFIFLGAEGEERMVQARSLLRGLYVEDVMTREFAALEPSDTVGRGLEMVYQTGQDDFPVVEKGRLLGIVSRQTMLEAVNRRGGQVSVQQVMETDVPAVGPQAKVTRVQDELFGDGWGSLPVMQDGRLVGMLSPENVSRYLLVQSSIKSARRRAAGQTPALPPVIGAVPPIAPPRPPAESVPPAGRA